MPKLLKSGFVKNFATLFTGNFISQLVAFLIIPLIADIYSPAEFGILYLFTSITNLLRIIATGRYDYAIILAENEKEANTLLRLSTKINILFCSVTLVLITLGKLIFPSFSYFQELGVFSYFIPCMAFLGGFSASCSYYLNKKKQYKTIAKADVTINTSISALKLGFGYAKFTQIGLISASIIGEWIGSIYYFFKIRRKPFYNIGSLKLTSRKFINFPLYVLPKQLIHNLSFRLPFLILVIYFGSELLGFYSMAATLSLTPIGLIAGALTKILFERFADQVQKKESVLTFYKKYITRIILFSLPVFILAFFIVKPVFELFFPEEWSHSIIYFQIILPWMFIYFISSPFDFVPNLFSEQKKAVIFDIIYFSLCLSGLVIGILQNDFKLSIFLFSIAGIINFLFLLFWYSYLLSRYEKSLQ